MKALGEMTIEELRETYRAEVGRPTDGSSPRYLIQKIQAARKGKIRTGKLPDRRNAARATAVVPIKMRRVEVDAVDEAARKIGATTRSALVRAAVHDFVLRELGEDAPDGIEPLREPSIRRRTT